MPAWTTDEELFDLCRRQLFTAGGDIVVGDWDGVCIIPARSKHSPARSKKSAASTSRANRARLA